MIWLGPVSSLFDYLTFALMWFVVCPAALGGTWSTLDNAGQAKFIILFQTGWFIESIVTQTLVVHVIRSPKVPFIGSRASWQLTMTTIAVMGIGVILPYSPLAQPLGFVPLPWQFWPWLGATLLCYVALAQLVKTWLARKGWI